MTFYTLSFLFCFLPLSMLLFYCTPTRFKNATLLLISLAYYALIDWHHLWLMVVSVLFDYAMSWYMRVNDNDNKKRRLALALSVIKSLGLFVGTSIISQIGMSTFPVGLLVYTMTATGYLVDVYRGDASYETNLIDFSLFCIFFGKIIVGPLVAYKDMREYLKEKRLSLSMISTGVLTLVSGVAKQVILAQGAQRVYVSLAAIPRDHMTVSAIWLLVLCVAMTMYFTLAGYCDMARGLGMIYSLKLPRNFYYPFQAIGVQEFFGRFNITINDFIRKYVFVTLGGGKNGTLQMAINLLLTGMLMGLWFGIRLNYLLWGVYLALFMILERRFTEKYLLALPKIIGRIITFAIVLLSFAVFAGDHLSSTLFYLQNMFFLGDAPFLNDNVSFILRTNYPILLLCLLFATSLLQMTSNAVAKRYPRLMEILRALAHIFLMFLTIGYLLTSI